MSEKKVKVEFNIVDEYKSETFNSFTKCLNDISKRLSLPEKEWYKKIIKEYDQDNFSRVDKIGGKLVNLQGSYSFELFFHCKKLIFRRLE